MDQKFEIHVAEASDVEARLEAVYRGEGPGTHLSGTITGPKREGSRTLPATVKLISLRRGDAPVAEAVLPDPCFWSQEMPFLYDVAVELRRGDDVLESTEFTIALHPQRVEKQ
jgi:Glycosyl hydrolases family 2